MHELSIAESILEAVRKELAGRPGAKPIRVGLRIGELAAVDVDSLTFCFEAVVRGTDWETLQLDAACAGIAGTSLQWSHTARSARLAQGPIRN
jgi:hydrogenase nickel incorporation protein HypA/HybF